MQADAFLKSIIWLYRKNKEVLKMLMVLSAKVNRVACNTLGELQLVTCSISRMFECAFLIHCEAIGPLCNKKDGIAS